MDLREGADASGHRHPWELARVAVILQLLQERNLSKVADIGSGDLFFARNLQAKRGCRIVACDIHYDEVDLGEEDGIIKIKSLDQLQQQVVDHIFLLDVLEHVEDEKTLLREAKKILTDDGRLIITVPAYQFLFSEHDVFLKHQRRYSQASLKKVLLENDLVIEKMHYFFTSLVILRLCTKVFGALGRRRVYRSEVATWQYPEKHFITRLVRTILKYDYSVNSSLNSFFNLSLPGLSLCAIVKKSA